MVYLLLVFMLLSDFDIEAIFAKKKSCAIFCLRIYFLNPEKNCFTCQQLHASDSYLLTHASSHAANILGYQ